MSWRGMRLRCEQPFAAAGIEMELFAVPGKVPLYLEQADPQTAEESGTNVGVELRAGGAPSRLRSGRGSGHAGAEGEA